MSRWLILGCLMLAACSKSAPRGTWTDPALDPRDLADGVVIGGTKSANTRHLWEITDRYKPSHLIQGPDDLRAEIDPINDRVYSTLNNGVYKCGFATTQDAYDANVYPLFDTLDWLESLLSERRFLAGERFTVVGLLHGHDRSGAAAEPDSGPKCFASSSRSSRSSGKVWPHSSSSRYPSEAALPGVTRSPPYSDLRSRCVSPNPRSPPMASKDA